MTFSVKLVHGGRLTGMPGGIRPHKCVNISTRMPLDTLIEERCFCPEIEISEKFNVY